MWIPPDLGVEVGGRNSKKKAKEPISEAELATLDPRPKEGFISWDKDSGTQKDELAAFQQLKRALQGSVKSKYKFSSQIVLKRVTVSRWWLTQTSC